MSVYINMEMPKEGSCIQIVIDDDGNVYPSVDRCIMQIGSYATAVPVPPHGRLIDANEFLNRAFGTGLFGEDDMRLLKELTDGSPTIIPTEEGE